VTVIAHTAIDADALDNAFMLMGIKDSFELLKTLPQTGLFIVYRNQNGQIRDTCNKIFNQYLVH
jgi:hypothetical protein